LKQPINHGLQLKKLQNLKLTAFGDVDSGGNIDDRTSTSSFTIYLAFI
jgi:hypothetical protein